MVELYVMPANEGDFLWLHYGDNEGMHNIIIDGGTEDTAEVVRSTLDHILQTEKIDAIFVTHIDADHIVGLGEGLALLEQPQTEKIDAIYLNTHRAAKAHLQSTSKIVDVKQECKKVPLEEKNIIPMYNKAYSPDHAISFMKLMEEIGLDSKLCEYTIMGQTLHIGGANLYILSPGERELNRYYNVYEDKAPKDEPEIYTQKQVPIPCKDLSDYKETDLRRDTNPYNRSSISFLFCYNDIKLLFLGDSAATVCMRGVRYFPEQIGKSCAVDAIKVSHHGSNYNISPRLLATFPTNAYVLSTNGKNPNGNLNVPHRATIAQILRSWKANGEGDYVNLLCNYPWWETTYNNEYFTEKDKDEYLRTGILHRVNLQEENFNDENRLRINGRW